MSEVWSQPPDFVLITSFKRLLAADIFFASHNACNHLVCRIITFVLGRSFRSSPKEWRWHSTKQTPIHTSQPLARKSFGWWVLLQESIFYFPWTHNIDPFLYRTLIFTEFVWIAFGRAWLSVPKERSLLVFISVILRRSAKVPSLSSLQRTKFLPVILITACPSWDLSAQFLWSCRPRYFSPVFYTDEDRNVLT